MVQRREFILSLIVGLLLTMKQNDTEKEVGWNDIADGTLYILQKCSRDAQYVKGQAFYKDKWNVIVRYDNDSC